MNELFTIPGARAFSTEIRKLLAEFDASVTAVSKNNPPRNTKLGRGHREEIAIARELPLPLLKLTKQLIEQAATAELAVAEKRKAEKAEQEAKQAEIARENASAPRKAWVDTLPTGNEP